MTAPIILPPPKSFRGLSPRELMSAEDVGNPGTPLVPGRIPDVDLTIAHPNSVKVLTAQPSGETAYWPGTPWFDTRAFNQMRVVLDNVETAGHTTSRVIAKYASTVGGSFATPGAAAAEVSASMATTGPKKSTDWVALDPAAIGDRLWKALGVGGNGALSPVVGGVHFQFRQATAPPPVVNVPALFDALFYSDQGFTVDTARTTPQTTNGGEGRGWTNQITGATVHGVQNVAGAGPRLDTFNTLNGYQSLRFQSQHNIVFPDLFLGSSEGTLFLVTSKPVEIGQGSLWTMGGNAGNTTIYPDSDGFVKDSALSTVRHVTADVDPAYNLTQAHIYAVRSKNGDWANYINGVQLYTTATNTYQGGGSDDGILGINWITDEYNGWVWMFGFVTRWLSDAEMTSRFESIADRYGISI